MLIRSDPLPDTVRFKNLFAAGSRGRLTPRAAGDRKDPWPRVFFINILFV